MCSESPALLSRASAGILQVHWAGGCPVFLWVTRMGHEVPHTSGDPWPLRPAAASAPLCECGAPAALSPGPVGMCLRLLDVPMTSTVAHSPDDITNWTEVPKSLRCDAGWRGPYRKAFPTQPSSKRLTPIKALPVSLSFGRAALITLLQTPFNVTCTFVGASSVNEEGRRKCLCE